MKIYTLNGRYNASGEQVREARTQAGLSQEQLAAKVQLQGLNIGQRAISRIETGKRIVADYELPLLSEALGVTVYHLLGIEKNG